MCVVLILFHLYIPCLSLKCEAPDRLSPQCARFDWLILLVGWEGHTARPYVLQPTVLLPSKPQPKHALALIIGLPHLSQISYYLHAKATKLEVLRLPVSTAPPLPDLQIAHRDINY